MNPTAAPSNKTGMQGTAELCPTCKKNPAASAHTCPFQCEINDNEEFECHCCDDCRHECAMDI